MSEDVQRQFKDGLPVLNDDERRLLPVIQGMLNMIIRGDSPEYVARCSAIAMRNAIKNSELTAGLRQGDLTN